MPDQTDDRDDCAMESVPAPSPLLQSMRNSHDHRTRPPDLEIVADHLHRLMSDRANILQDQINRLTERVFRLDEQLAAHKSGEFA